MQYGFVIDQEACIGCHACTVACKAENGVPVGDFRTWVKYVETGRFPDVKRHFAVLRCNHCTDAPCVTICPVNALVKRDDGIVDVDRQACIGCRACMQACPYDALYMNEDLHAVEKCHFCAHRVEKGLEPACVTVCPVGAIIPGDFHDADSPVSQLIRKRDVLRRRVEQGTGPNVYYIGAPKEALEPEMAVTPSAFLWSERPSKKPETMDGVVPAEGEAQVVWNAEHRVEWGWPVSLYLVTKSLAAGAALVAPFASALGATGFAAKYLFESLALLFTVMTAFLLVVDLGKKWAFYRLLTRPNRRSWLVKGAWILGGFGGAVALSLFFAWLGEPVAAWLFRLTAAVLALPVAGYTALLFAQCRGRDLWESALLLPHLLALALLCASGLALMLAPDNLVILAPFLGSALAHGALALLERRRRHETANARQAAAYMSVVRVGPLLAFRDGLLIGVVAACAAAVLLPVVALPLAVVGLLLYEHAYIRAGQLPPLS